MPAAQAQSAAAPLEPTQSVVEVRVTAVKNTAAPLYWGADAAEKQAAFERLLASMELGVGATGTGFFIAYGGRTICVTNYHVVQYHDPDQASIRITGADGREYAARFLGGDAFYDIAFLELDAPPYPTIPWQANAADGATGEVYAVKCPKGGAPGSGQTIAGTIMEQAVRYPRTGNGEYLRHSTPIERGDSGSPLFDKSGQLIGVNTAITRNGESYSLGMGAVHRLLGRLLDDPAPRARAYLGIQLQASALDAPPLLTALIKDGPAINGIDGARIGSRLVAINGAEVPSLYAALDILEGLHPGKDVTLVFETTDGGSANFTMTANPLDTEALRQTGLHILKAQGWRFDENQGFIYKHDNMGNEVEDAPHELYPYWLRAAEERWAATDPAALAQAVRINALGGGMELGLTEDTAEANEQPYLVPIKLGGINNTSKPKVLFY